MMKNIVVAVVFASVLASSIEALSSLEPCSLGQLDQLKPDPKNCSRFYECTLSGWVGNACNPGLEFNPATLYCDYPANVKCANESSLGNDLRQLEPCTELDKLIADPKNCSRFYECTLNGWVGLFCYPGLEFNPDTEQCDYPENVRCPNATLVGVPSEPCNQLDKLVPDDENCSRFYECTLNGWVGMPCSLGLYFNPDTLQCDYRWNVKCANESSVKVPEVVFTNEPCSKVDELKPDLKNCSRFYECIEAGYWVGEPCNVGLLFNPDTLQCDYPENVKCANETHNDGVPEPTCSPANYDELFPDPSNCNGFLQCSALGLVPMPCPNNLRFNVATSQCDYPWRVKC